MYVDDPEACPDRSSAPSHAKERLLSLLEKNRDGLAIRPGLRGDYEEALRVLDDPIAAGNLGIQNRSRSLGEWRELLDAAGWRFDSVVGIRLFSDPADDDLPDRSVRATPPAGTGGRASVSVSRRRQADPHRRDRGAEA